MGHVPPGPFPPAGTGPDLPGRQHRTPGRVGAIDLNRNQTGRLGERLARWYLVERGLSIVALNVRVGRGEIDILARDGNTRVAIEVRSRRGSGDPVDAAGPAKREQASRLARRVGAQRFDVMGVRIGPEGFDVHWVPAAS